MERLWTPWRRQFVEAAGNADENAGAPECFLCEKPRSEPARDRENLVLYRGDVAFVLLNLYPYNSGHLLVAPYQHTGDFAGLAHQTATELTRLTQRSAAVLQDAYQPEGFNVGMNLGKAAGAGLPDHLHVHVVPRWNGDTNFMPLLGETKVLPETLDQTYQRLVLGFLQ